MPDPIDSNGDDIRSGIDINPQGDDGRFPEFNDPQMIDTTRTGVDINPQDDED